MIWSKGKPSSYLTVKSGLASRALRNSVTQPIGQGGCRDGEVVNCNAGLWSSPGPGVRESPKGCDISFLPETQNTPLTEDSGSQLKHRSSKGCWEGLDEML